MTPLRSLKKHGVQRTTLRRHDEPYKWSSDYYDHLADLAFELIGAAASVSTKEFVGWEVQHNTIWSALFNFDDSKTRRIVLFKLRRLLYEEIKSLETMPNFKNGKYLGYCLNVLGFGSGPTRRHSDHPLRVAVISWTRKHYLAVMHKQPKAAKAALLGTISYDYRKKRLVKTYMEGLDKKPPQVFLELADPQKPATNGRARKSAA